MPSEWKELPVTGDPFRNVDEAELDGVSPWVQDAYIDELGFTQKRPGLLDFITLGTNAGVDGLFWWDAKQVVIAVSGGRCWKITDAAGTKTELTGSTFRTGTRVTFAPNGNTLVMANGGNMITTDLTSLTQMADADAPTSVSHVATLDSYTLANEMNSQRFWNSDVLAPLSWNAGSQQQANSWPDNLLGLVVGWDEILLVGSDSVEVWFDDGTTPFRKIQGGLIQRGCSAIYSVQQVGTNWFWLDEKRRFVKLDNRTPTVVSFPFNKQLQMFTAVNDAVSDMMEIDNLPLYVISFPSARRTFAYNWMKDAWSDWGSWNPNTASYERFPGNCYAFARPWNCHFVGDAANGKIYKASRAYYTDNGSPVRTIRRTGFVSHGTTQRKFSRELQIRCKRGAGNSSVTEPVMWVKWRNDGGAWGNEHYVSLGQVGQHEYVARLHQLGNYRVRQWEFGHTDNSEFILTEAKERIELAVN